MNEKAKKALFLENNPRDGMQFYITLSITILASFFLLIYGIINLLNKQTVIGIAEVSTGLFILSCNLIFLYIKKSTGIPVLVINIMCILLSFYLFTSGGIGKTGIYWCLIFPSLFISAGGLITSGIWTGIHLSSLILVFVLGRTTAILEVAYSSQESIAALAGYSMSCFILFSYEYYKTKSKEEIHVLQKLLPICSHCKKILDGEGNWQPVERVLDEEADILLSHGICPDCLKAHYPPEYQELLKKKNS